MDLFRSIIVRKKNQYLISILIVIITALFCYFASGIIGYRAVALILLLICSLNAILFDILPVMISALLSALIWNFFFIPPILTFHIGTPEDGLLFIMYFAIATINAVLTHKIRNAESRARDKEEKEHTIRLYNTLLNSLSHELKTPVATIIGAIDTLKEPKNKLSSTNQKELLSQIDVASVRLNLQIENLLNMSRLESGMLKIKLDWCDINELLFSVIQKLSLITDIHKIVFKTTDHLPLFKLDRGLMEQVLHNIIYNAILYTPDRAIININAVLSSDNCVITIADTGNGFPDSEIPFAFDKFYRLPNSKPGGSGLGLSIAKGFIEAHHGHLFLHNQKNGGAVFTISIPAEISFINNLKNE